MEKNKKDIVSVVRDLKLQNKSDDSIHEELKNSYDQDEISNALIELRYIQPRETANIAPIKTDLELSSSNIKPNPNRILIHGLVIRMAVSVILGIILGMIFAGGLFRQDYYFAEFSNMLLLITMPVSFFTFRALGYSLSIIYPFTLYYFGSAISNSESFSWLSDTLSTNPSDPQVDIGRRFATALIASVVWLAVTTIVEGSIKIKIANNLKQKAYIATICVAVLMGLGAFFLAGEILTARREFKLRATSLPGVPGIELAHLSTNEYELTYRNEDGRIIERPKDENLIRTSNLAEFYPVIERLKIDTFSKYKIGVDACTTASPKNSDREKKYTAMNIEQSNFSYGYAEFSEQEFTSEANGWVDTDGSIFLYCFVVNGDLYTLERSNKHTSEHLELYPAQEIMASIIGADQQLPPPAQNNNR